MSLETTNNKLFKYEDNDNGDLRFLHDSMDIIDNGISPFYVATLDSDNTYKIVTGLNKTSLDDGYAIKVAIPSNSTGAVSIIVDTVTVQVKKANGNAVTNFKANGVYTLIYFNEVFQCASGSVDDVIFTSDKLLTGYSANNSDGEKVDGTMANKGAVTSSLNCGGSYTIPQGYHNGSGKVTANSLASQTSATATASQILSGATAYVNGNKITGTIASQSAQTITPGTANKTIASGKYLSGAQTIIGDSNLIAGNIISGKSIFGIAGTASISSLGGYKGKVGTFKPNTAIYTITLGFKPDIVFIATNQVLGSYSGAPRYVYFNYNGITSNVVYFNTLCYTKYAQITPIDNGFNFDSSANTEYKRDYTFTYCAFKL